MYQHLNKVLSFYFFTCTGRRRGLPVVWSVIPLVPCHPEAEMGMNGNGTAAGLLMKFLTSSEISSNLAWHLVASNEELLDSKGVGKESVL